MISVKQAKVVSLIVAFFYIGTGTIQLLNLIGGNEIFLLGGGFDAFLLPGYVLGFALGYGGGKFWAMAGQAVMFLIAYGITFGAFLPIVKGINKKSPASNDT
ncbi:MAG TPA: hypothetical protein VF690_19800 [Hymenobacter sp.]|jgi:hypothetical protein